MQAVPQYYHSLAPFEAAFRAGLPVLTYHKLGLRPRGVRLKGLYVGEKLFAAQLSELRAAGFHTGVIGKFLPREKVPPGTILLTFDDGFANAFRHGLEPLRKNNFSAIQFLVADLIGRSNEWDQRDGEIPEALMDASQVREWLAAGHQIGSHTCTHPRLPELSRERAREEICASKKKLEDLFGEPVEHFCYPYGAWNPALADLVAAAGYQSAFTTEPGVNLPGTSALALKRFTARYESRNLKWLWSRLLGRFL